MVSVKQTCLYKGVIIMNKTQIIDKMISVIKNMRKSTILKYPIKHMVRLLKTAYGKDYLKMIPISLTYWLLMEA